MRKPYPDDLNDKEWEQIGLILEQVKKVQGRPPIHDRREILNALFYMLRTGCQWRCLPNDFPPWKAVYGQFLRGRQRGILEQIHHALRRELRTLIGRDSEPSAGIVDNVHRTGLEPVTTRFEAGYSIRLSYRCKLQYKEQVRIQTPSEKNKVKNAFGTVHFAMGLGNMRLCMKKRPKELSCAPRITRNATALSPSLAQKG
jgi:transposase